MYQNWHKTSCMVHHPHHHQTAMIQPALHVWQMTRHITHITPDTMQVASHIKSDRMHVLCVSLKLNLYNLHCTYKKPIKQQQILMVVSISKHIFNHSLFIPLACVECDDSLPFSGASSIPLCYIQYFFLPLFSTNYSSILPHFILPSISWSTSQSYCFQIHTQYSFGNSIFFHSLYMPKPK
jgi:hypothetical protein